MLLTEVDQLLAALTWIEASARTHVGLGDIHSVSWREGFKQIEYVALCARAGRWSELMLLYPPAGQRDVWMAYNPITNKWALGKTEELARNALSGQ